MKTIRVLLILFITLASLIPVAETKAQSVNVSLSLFHQQLSPYGRWLHNPKYGDVWTYNDPSFRPYYSDGHWEYTNYGWSWVSDYDWGWAPFHYGRWENDPYSGWMWIPGYEWASAWVSWSSYDNYYGWAPLGYGTNINVSFGSIPYERWTFIPRQNICERDIKRYYVSPQRNYGFRNAVVINNYYGGNGGVRYMRGPERSEVERYTHNRVTERRIDDRERQGYFNRGNNNADNAFNSNDRNQARQRNNDVSGGDNNFRNRGYEERQPNRESNDRPQAPEIRNQSPQRDNGVPNGNNDFRNRGYEERKPNPNNIPQRNENSYPDQKRNEPYMNRGHDQQNNFPGRQQQMERPAPEQRQMGRPNGHDNGGGFQRPNGNNGQRQNSNNERRRKDN